MLRLLQGCLALAAQVRQLLDLALSLGQLGL